MTEAGYRGSAEEDAEGVFDPRLLTSGLAFGGDGEVSRVESMLAVPVLGVKGEVVAVLQALHPQKNAFRQRHLTLVSMYARMLSVALQNQKLAVARLRDLQRGLKKLLDCESVVIHERAGPWNKVVSLKPGETGMREFPQDVGVVGFVLKTCGGLFDLLPIRQIDQPSGKQVRSLLCCPLQDGYSHCNGVVMATHKRVGSFSRSDEALLKALCVQYGEILASREKFQELQRNNETLSFLLSASRSLSSQTALPDIVSAAQKLAADLVKCEASNIFVHDPENRSLFTFHPSGRLISVPISDASVVGVCFSLGEALRIEDVYMDERFKRQRSALVEQGGNALSRGGGAGFGERRQCAMLCSPVIRKGEVLAVVQLVRTFDPSLSSPAGSAQEAFSGAEEQRLQEFAQMVAMPSLNAFQANRPAYRVLDLVDDLSLLASEVRNREALLINLKRIVRQNLLCEKVNVYSIDLVRQELTMESHLALQDDMDHIQAEIDSVADGLSPRAGHSAEVKARRATLVKDLELIKRKAEDLENSVVRMPFGVGIAGRVAATGGSANLREVTRREALESEMTSVGGGESKTMLLHCAYDATGEIVALIQAINKRQGNFTRDDEQLLARLSGQAGIMLRHTAVASSCSSEERLAALVAQEGTLLIGARRCTLWLLDSASKSVSSVDESGVAKVVKVRDLANSVVGMAAISCELQTQGRPTKNRDALWKSCSLGQPVLGRQTSGELLGVIECVNKRGGAFDDDDKYFIDIFASVTAATLDSLRLIKSLKARWHSLRPSPYYQGALSLVLPGPL
ncbi:hypothetical protein T484DRAFT_1777288 [Baffinella frigidus]|nr:hypothetical protein T484DRAFT_1777288 [Cryptophyta sp. CCMP2293]